MEPDLSEISKCTISQATTTEVCPSRNTRYAENRSLVHSTRSARLSALLILDFPLKCHLLV